MTTAVNCARCGNSFARKPGRGRRPRWCSNSCRQAAYRERTALPPELTSRARWVRHVSKRPIAATGRPASVTDPATWSTYATAAASRVGHGLGYVLGDGIGCIDLDHVIEGGLLDPRAARIIASLPATYTEVSPSGTGLHLWFLMPEAPGTVRTITGISVETYSRERYITVTGTRWPETPATLAALPAATPNRAQGSRGLAGGRRR